MSTFARICVIALIIPLVGCSSSPVNNATTTTTVPPQTCAIGAFVNGLDNLADFQAKIDRQLAVVLWYVHWQEPFPQSEADQVANNGSVPLITWEPWITDPAGTLEAIAAGSYESYVRAFFQAAKEWGKPVLLRFAHEMNGNWYPWDGAHNGESAGPDSYKKAWTYIYNVKQAVGAANVALVWCPNNYSLPDADWNELERYYPGDACVDWIGMDGYNWGYDKWQSFDLIFADAYAALAALTAKPLMIGEFASAENGGSKEAWIADAFARIGADYPRIKLFCWFNINKERDWRIESSAGALAAFKKALQNEHFSSKM
ncbi:MAG: glycosyl hydrolase [Candidatus Margulisiibacteriota bacterium]